MPLHTFLENVEAAVPVPENGILSRTVFQDDSLKVVAFAFSAGQELSAHTAPMAAILYFVKGEAEVTLGAGKDAEALQARAGSLVHMPPQLTHGIVAKTPLVMLLMMLKQVRTAA
jgi:quercetin dioxygenase-like cupin family protein